MLRVKVGFPNKILGIPIGWKDRGWIASSSVRRDGTGGSLYTFEVHAYCSNRLKIGIENGAIFKFCPICLVVIKQVKKGKTK